MDIETPLHQKRPRKQHPPRPPKQEDYGAELRAFGIYIKPEDLASSKPQEASSTAGRKPIIRKNGPPSEVLFQCPEEKILYYSTVWYRLAAQPDFLVCSRCYVSHIKDTFLARPFTRFTPPVGAPSRCRFWVPRIVSILWPQALRLGSIRKIIEFADRRKTIPDCPEVGSDREDPEKQRRWFSYVDEQIGRLDCCEACYEDRVLGTAFASRFEVASEPLNNDAEPRKCMLRYRSVQHSLETYARRNGWAAFLAAVRQRLRASNCRGELVTACSTDRIIQIGANKYLWVCESCFLDKVATTAFHGHFSRAGNHTPDANGKFRCALASGPMVVALEAARIRNDYRVFKTAVKDITKSKFCSQSGIRGGPWYTLQGGCEGFQICQACYCGIIAPSEMGSFFDLADSQANSDSMVRLCDLNPASPRFLCYVEKLAQVVDIGDFSVFDRYVRRIVLVSTCPRRTTGNMRLWCVADGCTVCPECFETVAADTEFAHRFVIQCVRQPSPTICSLSSSGMRLKWAEACRDGSIEDFLTIARFRQEIYEQASSAINHIKRLHGSRFGQALADILFECSVIAKKGHHVSAREDHSASGNSRPDSLLTPSTASTTFEDLVRETLADTRLKEERWLIEEIKSVWDMID
ncbi:hypothetical protein PGQ11_006036 [Apiospora arundinis]|uniref:Integral membrane protein n=1 Tax=Apiospora arundinis TaxID=335852 RepID=A0ABR2ISI6_9PEZI